MKKTSLFIVAGLICFGFFAHAEDEDREPAAVPADPSTQAPSVEERARVKKRLYPGGRDEDSLQVQAQLPVSTRQTAEEPAEPDDHD